MFAWLSLALQKLAWLAFAWVGPFHHHGMLLHHSSMMLQQSSTLLLHRLSLLLHQSGLLQPLQAAAPTQPPCASCHKRPIAQKVQMLLLGQGLLPAARAVPPTP